MDVEKPVIVVNTPPVMFVSDYTKQLRTGRIQGTWYLGKSVAVIITVGVPVKEDF